MKLDTTTAGQVVVLHLHGRFDTASARQVTDAIESAVVRSSRVIANLAQVPFLDSTALATLVRGMRRCRERGGDLYLCGMQQPVYMIFELTRLNKAFSIYVDIDQALQAFELATGEEPARV